MTLDDLDTIVADCEAAGFEWVRPLLVVRRDRLPRTNRIRIAPGLMGKVIAEEEGREKRYRIICEVRTADLRAYVQRARARGAA